jgi:hypothetical protein
MPGWGVVLVVWAMLAAAHGQSCVPFEGAPLTRHKCDAVVTWSNVLLLPGQSYDDVRCVGLPPPPPIQSLFTISVLCSLPCGSKTAWLSPAF